MPDEDLLIYRDKKTEQAMQFQIGEQRIEEADLTLYKNPDKGNFVTLANFQNDGVRKLRSATRDKGASSGSRIIYFYDRSENIIVFLTVYTKSDKADLTIGEYRKYNTLGKEIVAQVKQGKIKLNGNTNLFHFSERYTEAKIQQIMNRSQGNDVSDSRIQIQETNINPDPKLQREIQRFAETEWDFNDATSVTKFKALINKVKQLAQGKAGEIKQLREEFLQKLENFKTNAENKNKARAQVINTSKNMTSKPKELKPPASDDWETEIRQRIDGHLTQADIERREIRKLRHKLSNLEDRIKLEKDAQQRKHLEDQKVQTETKINQRHKKYHQLQEQIKAGKADATTLKPDLSKYSLRDLRAILRCKTHRAFILEDVFELQTLLTDIKALIPQSFSSYQKFRHHKDKVKRKKENTSDTLNSLNKTIASLEQEKENLQNFIAETQKKLKSLSSGQKTVKALLKCAEDRKQAISSEIESLEGKRKLLQQKLDKVTSEYEDLLKEAVGYDEFQAYKQDLDTIEDVLADKEFFDECIQGENVTTQLAYIEEQLTEIREKSAEIKYHRKHRELYKTYQKWGKELEEKTRELNLLQEQEIFRQNQKTHQHHLDTIDHLEGQRTFLLDKQNKNPKKTTAYKLQRVDRALAEAKQKLFQFELEIIEAYGPENVNKWKKHRGRKDVAPTTKKLGTLSEGHAVWWAEQGLTPTGRYLYQLKVTIVSANKSVVQGASDYKVAVIKAIDNWKTYKDPSNKDLIALLKKAEKKLEHFNNGQSAFTTRQTNYEKACQNYQGNDLQQNYLDHLNQTIGINERSLLASIKAFLTAVRKYIATLKDTNKTKAQLSKQIEKLAENKEDINEFFRLEKLLAKCEKLPANVTKCIKSTKDDGSIRKSVQKLQDNIAKSKATLEGIQAREIARQKAYKLVAGGVFSEKGRKQLQQVKKADASINSSAKVKKEDKDKLTDEQNSSSSSNSGPQNSANQNPHSESSHALEKDVEELTPSKYTKVVPTDPVKRLDQHNKLVQKLRDIQRRHGLDEEQFRKLYELVTGPHLNPHPKKKIIKEILTGKTKKEAEKKATIFEVFAPEKQESVIEWAYPVAYPFEKRPNRTNTMPPRQTEVKPPLRPTRLPLPARVPVGAYSSLGPFMLLTIKQQQQNLPFSMRAQHWAKRHFVHNPPRMQKLAFLSKGAGYVNLGFLSAHVTKDLIHLGHDTTRTQALKSLGYTSAGVAGFYGLSRVAPLTATYLGIGFAGLNMATIAIPTAIIGCAIADGISHKLTPFVVEYAKGFETPKHYCNVHPDPFGTYPDRLYQHSASKKPVLKVEASPGSDLYFTTRKADWDPNKFMVYIGKESHAGLTDNLVTQVTKDKAFQITSYVVLPYDTTKPEEVIIEGKNYQWAYYNPASAVTGDDYWTLNKEEAQAGIEAMNKSEVYTVGCSCRTRPLVYPYGLNEPTKGTKLTIEGNSVQLTGHTEEPLASFSHRVKAYRQQQDRAEVKIPYAFSYAKSLPMLKPLFSSYAKKALMAQEGGF